MKIIFAVLAALYVTANALDCNKTALKITIQTYPGEYEFDRFEQYELRATIAYSIQKFCNESVVPDEYKTQCAANKEVQANNVSLTDPTERISTCASIVDLDPDLMRMAIKVSKANLNGALLLTDDTLYVDGIQPTLSPVPDFDFEPWLIAYIVIFVLIILGGVAMVIYTKFYSKPSEDDKKSIMEEAIEDDSDLEYETVLPGKSNASYQHSVGEEMEEAPVTML